MRTTITRMKCDGCANEQEFMEAHRDFLMPGADLVDRPSNCGWTKYQGRDACPKCSEAVQKAINGILGGKV